MKKYILILFVVLFSLSFISAYTESIYGTRINPVTTITVNTGDSINDTNASTECTGTLYLAGNGSCLDVSAIGGDTNETTRFNLLVGNCSANQLVFGIDSDGNKVCVADAGNSSWNESLANTLYRSQSWDNFTGIPTATPSDGDTTHLSTADQIRDWVIGLAYATTTYADSLGNFTAWDKAYSYLIGVPTLLSNFTDDLGDRGYTHLSNFTGEYIGSLSCSDTEIAKWNNTASAWECESDDDTGASETDPYWTANLSNQNASWVTTFNSTYDAYNDSGYIKDWNASTFIKDWNQSTFIKNWNATGYIKDWNATGYIKDWSGDFATNTKVDSLGNWSADKSGYATTGYADSLGNFSAWDNITGIPHATPSDGDTTHFSLSDEIYDFIIALAYATTTYVDSLGNWSSDKSDYWNASLDLDTVISDDEIAESKIAFSTTCGSGNHFYLNGNDLACEVDADSNLTENDVEGYLFDSDNTANLNMSSYNITMTGGDFYSNSTCVKIKGATSVLEIC